MSITPLTHSPGPRHALVLGATGGLGGALSAGLLARGWTVMALSRTPTAAACPGPIHWHQGDALRLEDVLAAAQGAALIVHAVNPPGYRDWRGLAIPMLANSIAAAAAAGARLLFPGNVYNFGPDAGSVVAEDAPQNPATRKGRVRADMEAMLRQAANRGTRSLVVRAGDFFGPGVTQSWFAQLIAKTALAPRPGITYPGGDPQAGHAWAFMPDLAETMLRLVDREAELPTFADFHFGGRWVAPGLDMAHAVRDAISRPDLPVRIMPWWPLVLAAPFATFPREALEMRYLWSRSVRLDNRKLVALLGEEPHTPLADAVRGALGLPLAEAVAHPVPVAA
ncbi:MAG: NAD-dependent epimerase/dehydratase family protein [Alsobacter sp.]